MPSSDQHLADITELGERIRATRREIAASPLGRLRAQQARNTSDVVTLSIALMHLLEGEDADAREILELSGLTADELQGLAEAGTRLAELVPGVVRGRRR